MSAAVEIDADALAADVLPLVRNKARRYARVWGCDPDELESVGCEAVRYAMSRYDPDRGGFRQLAMRAAARKMIGYAKGWASENAVTVRIGAFPADDDGRSLPLADPATLDDPGELPFDLADALATLTPWELAVFTRRAGLVGDAPWPTTAVAQILRLDPKRVEAIYARAYGKVSDRVIRLLARD